MFIGKNTLKKVKYENLVRLAEFLKIKVSEAKSPGHLAYIVAQTIERRRRRKEK